MFNIPIVRNYQGTDVTFRNENGKLYVNATEMSKPFGKKPHDYLRLPSTIELLDAIKRNSLNADSQPVISRVGHPQNGGGTWLREDVALDYAQWLSVDFRLWCNEQLRMMMSEVNAPAIKSQAEELEILTRTRFSAIKEVKEMLRLDDSSVAMLTNPVLAAIGLPAIPYVNSNGARFSAKHLLEKNEVGIDSKKFNKIMEDQGYLEHKSRYSTKGKDNLEWFWVITDKGLEYGENVVSPHNPRSTQPLWFEGKFPELLRITGIKE